MDFNWIQKHVLLELVRHSSASVKSLRPVDVEPNLFSYHLQGLITAKLIQKIGRGTYTLTLDGEKYVGAYSTSTQKIVENIKTVIMFSAEKQGKQLLFQWSRQPYIGRITLPYNRVPLGSRLDEAIATAMKEKIGITLPATYIATGLIKIMKQHVIVSHMNALIYSIDGRQLDDAFVARNGMTLWDNNDVALMGGVRDTITKLRAGNKLIESTWTYQSE